MTTPSIHKYILLIPLWPNLDYIGVSFKIFINTHATPLMNLTQVFNRGIEHLALTQQINTDN